jgi:hypothetical protein
MPFHPLSLSFSFLFDWPSLVPSKPTINPCIFHLYCWVEGNCNLVKTCPTSYIFALFYCLTFICCTYMILKPNLCTLEDELKNLL